MDAKTAISHHFWMPRKRSAKVQFGERVRRLRRKVGLSQEQLADQAALDRSYVGSVERGERNISLDNICKLALALKQPAHVLLRDVET